MTLRRPSSDSDSSGYSFSSGTSITSDDSLGATPMRVFLVQTARGLFSSSGGYKANICLLRHLASRGHVVRQLCYSYRNEAEEYVSKMATSGHHQQLRKRMLHLRSDFGQPGTDVVVSDLVMDDGVEFVALESEAFDAAFGGKESLHKEMGRETAQYIEVIEPRQHCDTFPQT